MAVGGGTNPISVNQAAQYGDKSAIEAMKTATAPTTPEGMPKPAPTAGNPAVASPQPGQAPGTAPGVDPGSQQMMEELAIALRTKQFWDNVLQQSPSEWSRMYAADATKNYQRVALQLRNNTPYFEE